MEKTIRKESEWSEHLHTQKMYIVRFVINHLVLGSNKAEHVASKERAQSWRTPLWWPETAKCLKQSAVPVQKAGSVFVAKQT